MIKTKPYDWIILFLLFISAIARLFMEVFSFDYVNYFIAVVNLIGLDYSATTILNCINDSIMDKIDKSDFILREKTNKREKHKKALHWSIIILIIYNLVHLFLFSHSVGNDMLSMIVLAISITDNSIVSYIKDKIKI